jgi:hypothetical protein
MAPLTVFVGDGIVEHIFLNPLLKAVTITSDPKIVQDAIGPLLRINTRRITIYHYLTFSGIERPAGRNGNQIPFQK